ncbi:2-dehydro-3-deoxygalactonokinase [Marimonas arenosa]|uniref:2-dehydro-3-deoxygalactonokinase n=1 Tax=Marimonas arenosa TaxID=1795305 RepID=A0AAE3WGI7_9RHOB|nr:2-dehydro-3-deoxygalactonokinase [Marimonas arenosa]MDQ2092292.1 2-dehydro-3-deoxygalactonokinase [Marimonas arenosa]
MDADFWIAADWGTTYLRAWMMSGATVVAELKSDRGMGKLRPADFEPALLELIEPWLAGRENVEVLVCGMVGARQGWIETPYMATPTAPGSPGAAVNAPVRDGRIEVRILPGLCQANPPDVMRGEETQIAGLVLEQPGYSGIVCLPGTHSKWVHLNTGIVQGFQTFMTGEVFELMSKGSVLRHSITDTGWDTEAFIFEFRATLANPASLWANFFSIRAQALLADTAPGVARARLSGMLVGAEFAAAGVAAADAPITIIGDEPLAIIYRDAFKLIGIEPSVVEAKKATLLGLCAARSTMKGDRT